MKRKMMDIGELTGGKIPMPSPFARLAEYILGFTTLNNAHYKIDEDWDNGSEENFFRLACQHMPLKYQINEDGLDYIPKEGPCVIVSNHPHGFSDGIIFGDIAMRARSDIRIVVNEFLHCVFGMRPYSIQVDVYGGEEATRANMASMRQLLKWLREGHCVLVFPSGSVATYSKQDKRVIDDPWQSNIATIIRKTKATVVPMHIFGRTSLFFQTLSVLCKNKRASFLPREIMRDTRNKHYIRLGQTIKPISFPMMDNDEQLSDYLRLRSSLLSYEPISAEKASPEERVMEPIAPPLDIELLRAEIAALPKDAIYHESEISGICVYMARAAQIPNLLKEIGIQREIIFRSVGEGSGKAYDLDQFDPYYGHLILWDTKANALAGAYRMGFTDEILENQGVKGLYSSLFYKIDSNVLPTLRQGLEMGRAFIKKEYQRLPNSLDALWIGIGRYMTRHPQYRYLYGLVSVSDDYSHISRSCILSYMQENESNSEIMSGIKALNPAKGIGLRSEDNRLIASAVTNSKILSRLVSDLEDDTQSIPVLLKHYLRLNGKSIGFSLDPDFGNTLDCLILVDMAQAPQRLKKRYLGEDSKL